MKITKIFFYINYLSGNFLTFLWCRHGRCSLFHCHCNQHIVCRHSAYRPDRAACDWRWFQTSDSIGHTPPHLTWFSQQSPQFFLPPLSNIPQFCWNVDWTNEFSFYSDYLLHKIVKKLLILIRGLQKSILNILYVSIVYIICNKLK